MSTVRQPARAADFATPAKRLLRLLGRERAGLAGVLGLGSTSIILNVLGPWILGHVTDLVFAGVVRRQTPDEATNLTPGEGIDFHALGITLGLALGVYVASGLFWVAQGRLTTKIIQRTVRRLRSDVEAKLARLPLSYLDRQPRGEVLSRVTNDIDNTAQNMQQTLSQITNSLLLVIAVLVMMFWISPLLAVIAVIAVPVSMVFTTAIGRRAQRQFAQQSKTTGAMNAYVEEMYTGHALLRILGLREDSSARFRRQNEELRRASFRAHFLSGLIQPVISFVGHLNYVAVAVVGGLQIVSGGSSIGNVQALIQYSRQLGQPLSQLASLTSLVQSGVASAERVFELLDVPEQSVEPPTPARPAHLNGRIVFESVSFRYEPGTPLVENLSLTVEPGQTVAIVGPTGAGKTTLINLLLRFYEVTDGRITLDGVDIATMSRRDLRSAIGLVSQDAWLFHGSIADNIAYGAECAPRELIEHAARAAHADHFIRTLPDGYDTVIDDDGRSLSAGEKQLITIARAALSEPVVLVLDEATSSVDTRTEVLVQQALSHLSKDRTSFVVAHRLSTIREADLIIVMMDGAIVEHGKHAELLAAAGFYAQLHAAGCRHQKKDAEPAGLENSSPQLRARNGTR